MQGALTYGVMINAHFVTGMLGGTKLVIVSAFFSVRGLNLIKIKCVSIDNNYLFRDTSLHPLYCVGQFTCILASMDRISRTTQKSLLETYLAVIL